MTTRTDLVASLAIPPTGISWGDMQEALRDLTLQSFMASAPAPFLLEVGALASDLPAGLEPRLAALNGATLTNSRIHHLVHRNRPLVVGRSQQQSEIVLDDETVSKRHASLEPTQQGWRLVDLEAANGTWVEAARARVGVSTPVKWGGLIRFSNYRALLLSPQSLFALAVDLAPQAHSIKASLGPIPAKGTALRELIVRVKRLDRSLFAKHCSARFLLQIPNDTELEEEELTEDLPGAATRAISQSRILRLRRGKRVGLAWVHVLWPKSEGVVLGRGTADVEAVINEDSASKHHAKLRCSNGQWQITDLDSRNGTYVEGKRLEPGLARNLRPGQTLAFSSYRALFLGPEQLLSLLARTEA